MPLTRGQKYALYFLLANTDGGSNSKSHLRETVELKPKAEQRRAMQDYAVKLDITIDPNDIGDFDFANVASMRTAFDMDGEYTGPACPDAPTTQQLFNAIKNM